jgi:hypothetical protein
MKDNSSWRPSCTWRSKILNACIPTYRLGTASAIPPPSPTLGQMVASQGESWAEGVAGIRQCQSGSAATSIRCQPVSTCPEPGGKLRSRDLMYHAGQKPINARLKRTTHFGDHGVHVVTLDSRAFSRVACPHDGSVSQVH